MLTIARSLLEEIKRHGIDSYPNECCGLIVGDYGRREVRKLFPLQNTHDESTLHRYRIDPKEHLQAGKQARATGLDVIGVYHSHPDSPGKPSEYDRAHAWPVYVYIIVSVLTGKAEDVKAWTLREDGSGFDETNLRVVE